MTRALPPHSPPTNQHGNVRPISASIAIIQRPDAAADAMFEQLSAVRRFAQTTCLLQRRIDALEAAKRARMKELTVAVKRCHDDLGQHLTGQPFAEIVDTIAAVMEAINAGETPDPADIKDICARIPASREHWIQFSASEALKAAESKRLQAKIDEVAYALAKLLRQGLDGTRDQQESPQADLPGVDKPPPPKSAWEPKVQRTIFDTVAEEVRTSAATAKTAAAAGDARAAEEAERARKAAEDLREQLLASGFVLEQDEGEADDGADGDDDAPQVELELADEPVGDDDGVPPDAIDIGDAQTPAPPMDPADHPALKGHIAAQASKREQRLSLIHI
jgi:hypothetical protein